MTQFPMEVITPNGILFSGEVVSCTMPGIRGKFQILNNHADLLVLLDVGEIKIRFIDKERSMATSGGMVEVKTNKTNIILETAEWADEIDIERAKAAKERAEKRLVDKDNIDYARAELALARACNRIKIASKI
jgi:F-type H+-transporting ATPase subunit epsilon